MHYLYVIATAERSALFTAGQNTTIKQKEEKIYKRGILSVTLYPSFATTRYKQGWSVHVNCVSRVSPANTFKNEK
jgi:hypothetical protein